MICWGFVASEQEKMMDMDDEGRPVKPHRSGTIAVVGGAPYSLALAAALAALAVPVVPVVRPEWGDTQKPINTGRRAEKDNAALVKAEAKRQRKAAKRLDQP